MWCEVRFCMSGKETTKSCNRDLMSLWSWKAGHMPQIVSLLSHSVIFAMFHIQLRNKCQTVLQIIEININAINFGFRSIPLQRDQTRVGKLIPLVFYMLRFLHFIMVLNCVGRLVIGELFVIQISCMWFNWFKIHLICFKDLITWLV